MKFWVTQPNKQHAVKLTQLKLELGLFGARLGAANDKVAFEITGIATKKEKSKPKTTPLPLVPFSKRRHTHCHTTCSRRFLSSKSPSLVWDARDLCGFHLLLKDHSLDVCDIAFHVLYVRTTISTCSLSPTFFFYYNFLYLFIIFSYIKKCLKMKCRERENRKRK